MYLLWVKQQKLSTLEIRHPAFIFQPQCGIDPTAQKLGKARKPTNVSSTFFFHNYMIYTANIVMKVRGTIIKYFEVK